VANLGDIGKAKAQQPHWLPPSNYPGLLGDSSRGKWYGRRERAWPWWNEPNHQTAGAAVTIPTSRRVSLTLGTSGRLVDVQQGASGATFYDVADGTYYAHEADGTGLWLVTIVNAVPTIQQITPGYGLGVGQRPVVVAGGKNQLLAAGDFVLGVAMSFPALLSSGSLTQVALPSANTLPIQLSDGSSSTLKVTLNG